MATPLTMQAPGTISPDQIARTVPTPSGKKKRAGMIPMLAGSAHMLTLTGSPQYLTAKDRRLHAHANGAYFCTGCPKPLPKVEGEPVPPYRMFATREELLRGHKPPADLERAGEAHLYGFWSNDALGAPDPKCRKCQSATAEARKADPNAGEIPCADHHGGALGLLSPDDPASFAQ